MKSDPWAQAIHQYEEQQRQARVAREQERVSQQRLKSQQAEEQQARREIERIAVERRRTEQQQVERLKAEEQRRRNEEQRATLLAQSAEALRIAEQQRQAAQLAVSLKRQEEQKVKQAGSPIEIAFKEAWCMAYPEIFLESQFKIGRFRVDFAHLGTKTAIELDGHPTHHTRQDRTKDYQRQRWIEEAGWNFVRFTGSEIFNDVESCVQTVWKRIEKGQNT